MAKGNPGIQKLHAAMKKISIEVNDQEICRRLENLVITEKEDLPLNIVKKLLEKPEAFDATTVSEPYSQYIRHYQYMLKRQQRISVDSIQRSASSRKGSRKKASPAARKPGAAAKKKAAGKKTPAKKAVSRLK